MKAEQSERMITSELREIVSGSTVRSSSDVQCVSDLSRGFVQREKKMMKRVEFKWKKIQPSVSQT